MPWVVLADEPTGNLDTQSSANVMALLARLNSETGVTAMVIPHDDRWQVVASRVVEMADGKVVGPTP